MAKRKTLKELTLKDNFMFGAVMCDEENCRRLLELVLQFPIERVEVPKELVKFLKFMKADLEDSIQDFGDDFVKLLQQSVQKVKRKLFWNYSTR